MQIDMRGQTTNFNYAWMTQAVLPRPIAWVLSENDNGDYNLAPFSYFNALCSAPPLLGFSLSRKPQGMVKDTLYNIRARGYFTVHIASASQLPALNESSATLPYGESELTKLNLKTVPFADMARLEIANIAMFCRLAKEIALDENDNQKLMLGEIELLHADDSILAKDSKGRTVIDAQKVQPLARLSAGQYASLGEFMQMARPE